MAQRLLSIPQIGEVVLAKRRGSTRMRLSISASGRIRVGMPYWTPYEAGILFVKSQKQWILKQLSLHAPQPIRNGSQIGKQHRVVIFPVKSVKPTLKIRVIENSILVKTNLSISHDRVQQQLVTACEKALKQEADKLLPNRVQLISEQFQLTYRSLRIRKLTSRWGSCSSSKDITLSYYLIQLPWEMIDYVILHELAHTLYHHHGREFWDYMEFRLPDVGALRRVIKQYKPRVEPI
jgi:hypothetical protein